MKNTETWKRYKRLLSQYVKAQVEMSWAGSQPKEEYPLLEQHVRNCKNRLDAFMLTELSLRQIAMRQKTE